MFPLKAKLNTLKKFKSDQSGSILMITGILLVVLMTVAGMAIDYTRLVNTRAKMSNAVDAAILAAGIEFLNGNNSRTDLQETFENFFEANIDLPGDIGTDFKISKFDIDQNTGEISVKVDTVVVASLMQIAGFDEMDVTSEAQGIFSSTDVEVAMMLDVTGSMQGQKINDLKSAAKDAINILLPNNNTAGVRIGLVPYATSINAGRYASTVTRGNELRVASAGQFVTSQNVPTRSCVTGRGGRDATTETSYRDAPLGSDRRTVNPPRRVLRCPTAQVQPLTNNASNLRGQIDRYIAEGATAGHLGVAWSYYLLSEEWRDLYGANNKPARYSDDVKKIAILMTDGEFNTAYEGIDGAGAFAPFGQNANVSNARATGLCEDMKRAKDGNPGIIVYAIAFQAPASAEATLRSCANENTSNTTYYYSANSGAELRQAFREIASSISTLRISR